MNVLDPRNRNIEYGVAECPNGSRNDTSRN